MRSGVGEGKREPGHEFHAGGPLTATVGVVLRKQLYVQKEDLKSLRDQVELENGK